MSGLLRAEWIRFRKRRSLQVIVFAVPLLAAFLFLASFSAIGPEPAPFDAAAARAELIAEGYGLGLPPDQLEEALNEAVEAQRFPFERNLEEYRLKRSAYAFPQSLVLLLGNSTLVILALLLLVATTLGDEFGWATIRTVLLASSHRGRMLVVRLGVISLIGAGMLAALLVLGVVLPIVLSVVGTTFPATPALNVSALGVLVLGTLEAGVLIVGFAAMVTVLVRSGSLALVLMLVYVAIEAAVLTVLIQFEAFKENGGLAWVLDTFAVRGISRLSDIAARVASGLPRYPGEVIPSDLGPALVPLVSLPIWAAVFLAVAYWRFRRMDIAE